MSRASRAGLFTRGSVGALRFLALAAPGALSPLEKLSARCQVLGAGTSALVLTLALGTRTGY